MTTDEQKRLGLATHRKKILSQTTDDTGVTTTVSVLEAMPELSAASIKHLEDGPGFRTPYDMRTSTDELLRYALWEIREILESTDPSAPDNGRSRDSSHAGCCAMRADGALRRLQMLMEEKSR